MPKKTRTNTQRTFPLGRLFVGEAPPAALVRRGIAGLKKELTRKFEENQKVKREIARHMKNSQSPLIEILGRDKRTIAGVAGLKAFDGQLRMRTLAAVDAIFEEDGVTTDPTGEVIGLPFTYDWTWRSSSGNAALSVSSDKQTGKMGFSISNNGHDASGSAQAAMGIYLRSGVDNLVVDVTTTPVVNYDWWTICNIASAHSDGALGTFVQRFPINGGGDDLASASFDPIWDDDSWFAGAGHHSASGLSDRIVAQFPVDSRHWYIFWLYCNGSASGDGWGTFSGSGAGSFLNVAVPSITFRFRVVP